MKLIRWFVEPVLIEHKGINEMIKVNRLNYKQVLKKANQYHTSWTIVTRLESWFK